MTGTCPSCGCEQGASLLCASETEKLERELGDVASIVAELDVTISKQAKIGNSSGPSGLARERSPINWGASQVAGDLQNTLTTWARDVCGDLPYIVSEGYSRTAARWLLNSVDAIRRHPAVNEMVDEITDAISQARRVVDRPADRQYLGKCMVPTPDDQGRDVTCLEEVWARQGASFTACKVCGITHDVAERQKALLKDSRDLLLTVREAAQVIGSFGDRLITESTIRSYISKGKLGYHGKAEGSSLIRMGDLIEVLTENAANPKGRKLRRAS